MLGPRTFILAGLAAAAFVTTALAETVELRSGGTIVGTARLEPPDEIVVDAVFPEAKTITLKRSDVTPLCLHSLMEHDSPPINAARRRALAEFSESNGLYALAITDFLILKRLDPESAKDADKRIRSLEGKIADAILDDAQELIDDDNPGAALMYLHTVTEMYPESEAAKRARPMTAAAHRSAGASADVAVTTVSADEAPRVLEAVERSIAKGDEQRGARGSHVGSSVQDDLRPAERSIVHYESAWAAVKTLPVAPTEVPQFDERVRRLRASAKARLIAAHIAAGESLLQRRSIGAAERHCNSACGLEPDGEAASRLHTLILQAKILGYTAPVPAPSSK